MRPRLYNYVIQAHGTAERLMELENNRKKRRSTAWNMLYPDQMMFSVSLSSSFSSSSSFPLGPNEGEAHGWFERPEAVLSPCPWAFFITHRSNGRGTTEQRVVQGPCPGLLYHSLEQRKGHHRTKGSPGPLSRPSLSLNGATEGEQQNG